MTILERLAGRQVLVITGKGGVGKSAITAALGSLLAAQGRRVLLVEIDPRENLHQMLGIPPSGGELVQVQPRLALQNLRARQVIEETVHEHLRVAILSRRVVASPVFQHFVGGAPGLKEMAVLWHALRVLGGRDGRRGSFDTVLLDAPATGHALSLLMAPLLVSDVIQGGPFGRMARDLSVLVRDAGRTGVIVVTRAEEMPAREAIELGAGLEARIGLRPVLLVVNGVYPPFPVHAPPASDVSHLVMRLWQRRREVNEREIVRLEREWPGPRIELPLVPVARGPALLKMLARDLEHWLRSNG
jgi:anion-transporting  ArsA/GET3 family ATPase